MGLGGGWYQVGVGWGMVGAKGPGDEAYGGGLGARAWRWRCHHMLPVSIMKAYQSGRIGHLSLPLSLMPISSMLPNLALTVPAVSPFIPHLPTLPPCRPAATPLPPLSPSPPSQAPACCLKLF